jgi:tRNA modification GTPase
MVAPLLTINPFKLYGETGVPVFAKLRLENQVESVVLDVVSPAHLRVHCHGGEAITAAVAETLQICCGATVVDPFRWQRCQANSSETEALALLPLCRTERTAKIMLDQVGGAYQRAIDDLRIDELLSWSNVGLHLVEPFRVAVAGLPNVGKSSLLNAMVGYERSIVDDSEGTTRDSVVVETALDGWHVSLVDTAGIRETEDVVEKCGVKQAVAMLNKVDLTIEVIDVTTEQQTDSIMPPSIQVLNKSDLVGNKKSEKFPNALRVSAVTGGGVAELIENVVKMLVPKYPLPGQGVPFTMEQVEALRGRRV